MKRFTVLLNIVLALGLAVIGPASSITATAQGPGGVVHDGSGGYQVRSTPAGEAPVPAEQVSAVEQVPPYMELVFMSDAGGDWDVYDYKWEGDVTTSLTSNPADDWTPRAAPGGGRVVFVSDRDGNEEIYVVDFDGTSERRLTHNEYNDFYPSWSPSGSRLVFTSDRNGNEEIYTMDDDGSDVTRLTYDDSEDSCPAYSPDGKKIAFISNRSGNDDIWIMNADGTGLTNLTNNPADDWYPTWSPDGTNIAFSSWRTGDGEIWVQAVSGGAPVNLTNNPANDWAAVWSPDGQQIAFSSKRTGDEEVFLMPAGGGAATNVSNDPASNDRYPDFFWPRIVAQGSLSAQVGGGLPWQHARTWIPRGAPGREDRVWVQKGAHVTITDGQRKVVRQLTVNGTLDGNCHVSVVAPRGITLGTDGVVQAGQDGYLKTGCAVDLSAWPDGTITIKDKATVMGGMGAGVLDNQPAWDEDGGPVKLQAKNVVIDGLVEGGRGGDLGRHWRDHAGNGGSVTAVGEYITVGGTGIVRGGQGGHTNPDFVSPRDASDKPTHWQDGGDGGPVFLGSGANFSYWGTRQLTVDGTVRGGHGGDVQGPHPGHTGRGGDVKLHVPFGAAAVLNVNQGAYVAGGNGGDLSGRAGECTDCCVCGGNGGDLLKLTSFLMKIAGILRAGLGGIGRLVWIDGRPCGGNGFWGDWFNHPPTIIYTNTARESARNVWIYGGEGWGIDLSQVASGAITATEYITVAVGSGGQIDLRGHGAGENVLSAGQGIFLYADPGQIRLDPGVSLTDLTDPPAQVAPPRVIRQGFLHAQGEPTVFVGASAVVSLTLTNAGGGADIFQLAVSDAEGWSWQLSPGSLSLESMADGVAVATAAVPLDAVGLHNEVTFTAQSTADPSQMAVSDLRLSVVDLVKVYLPLVLRDLRSEPVPLYFDDFSDPGSGWLVGDYGSVAVDYDSGNYRVQIKEDDRFVWVSPQSLTFDGCTVEVEAWRSTGGNSSYGIVFGLDASAGDFYAFIVQPYLRQYALSRRDGDGWVTLIPYTDSSYINFNQDHNRLRVTREGSQIRLYVNDHYLASYTDSTYTGTRRVGIYASSGPESPIWLRYDDFTVWGPGYAASSTAGRSGEIGVMTVPSDWAGGDRTGGRANGD